MPLTYLSSEDLCTLTGKVTGKLLYILAQLDVLCGVAGRLWAKQDIN